MLFNIRRASDYDKKPCEEAKPMELIHIDYRTVSTLEAARAKEWGAQFFASGTNHREENGMVARDMEAKADWVINISSMKQLLDFYRKYGDIIITKANYREVQLRITIYDDYVE